MADRDPNEPASLDEPYVRPDTRAFLDMLAAMPGPNTHEVDPATARQMFTMMGAVADVAAPPLAVLRDIAIPGPAGDIPARYYDVRGHREGPTTAVLFFHGGGFVIGDVQTHEPFVAEMARVLDLPVISVDYRLAPEHPWPAAPDDCEAAARWLGGGPDVFPWRASGIVVSGDSAGGNLAIIVAQGLRDRPAGAPVVVQAPIYPAVGGKDWPSYQAFGENYLLTRDTMIWFMEQYQGTEGDIRFHPIEHHHAGSPPTLIITAGLDPLRDEGRAYAARLIDAGVDVSYREAAGVIHGFINLRKAIPSVERDVQGFLTALKAMIAEHAAG